MIELSAGIPSATRQSISVGKLAHHPRVKPFISLKSRRVSLSNPLQNSRTNKPLILSRCMNLTLLQSFQ